NFRSSIFDRSSILDPLPSILYPLSFESNHRSSPAACVRGSVAVVNNIRSAREYRANDLTLYADALTVNDPHPANSPSTRLIKIVFHHRPKLRRRYRMQIEHVLEFDDHRIRKRVVWIDTFVVIKIRLIGLVESSKKFPKPRYQRHRIGV